MPPKSISTTRKSCSRAAAAAVGQQPQRHRAALEGGAVAVRAVRAQHAIQRPRRVQRHCSVDRGAACGGRAAGMPRSTLLPATALEGAAVGMDVQHIGQPQCEEQPMPAVARGAAGEPALAQFEQSLSRLVDAERAAEALEDAAAVVRDQQLPLQRRLPHRHRHTAAAAVIDRVVEQFGEGVFGDQRHLGRQRETGGEVAPPRPVFLQAGERIAAQDLAQCTGVPAASTRRAIGRQPLRRRQAAQQGAGVAACDAQLLHQVRRQGRAMGQRGFSDPRRQRRQFDAG